MSSNPGPNDPKDPEANRSELSRRMLIGGAAAGTLGLAATALNGVLATEAAAQPSPSEGCFFALQIEGFFNAAFPQVSGLGSETLLKERGENQPVLKKVPGALKWGDIELKRGVSTDTTLWAWRKMVEDGHIIEARKNGSVVMFDAAGGEIARWNFTDGWPSKVHVQGSESRDAACAWEMLTLTVDSVRRETPER